MPSLEEKKKNPRKPNLPKIIPKNNLRKIRILKNSKLSQWMLSLNSGIPQSRISLIENSLIKPTKKDRNLLATALNTDSSEIFPDSIKLEVPFQKRQVKRQQPQMDEIEEINPLENL